MSIDPNHLLRHNEELQAHNLVLGDECVSLRRQLISEMDEHSKCIGQLKITEKSYADIRMQAMAYAHVMSRLVHVNAELGAALKRSEKYSTGELPINSWLDWPPSIGEIISITGPIVVLVSNGIVSEVMRGWFWAHADGYVVTYNNYTMELFEINGSHIKRYFVV